MNDDLEPLPDDLARAFDAERALVDDDPVMKRAVLAHVERAALLAAPIAATAGAAKVVGSGAASTAAASAKHVFTAKALALAAAGAFAVGTVTGGAVVTAARPTASASVSPAVVPPPPHVSTTTDVPVVPTLSASQLPSTVPTPEPVKPTPPATDLTRERELIDVGRAALAHENPQGALDAVERHRRAFPIGSLREERDALRVQALAAAGRTADAQRAAKDFHRTYPASLLSESVEAAVAPPR